MGMVEAECVNGREAGVDLVYASTTLNECILYSTLVVLVSYRHAFTIMLLNNIWTQLTPT